LTDITQIQAQHYRFTGIAITCFLAVAAWAGAYALRECGKPTLWRAKNGGHQGDWFLCIK